MVAQRAFAANRNGAFDPYQGTTSVVPHGNGSYQGTTSVVPTIMAGIRALAPDPFPPKIVAARKDLSG
jgi:hypothetical protein